MVRRITIVDYDMMLMSKQCSNI